MHDSHAQPRPPPPKTDLVEVLQAAPGRPPKPIRRRPASSDGLRCSPPGSGEVPTTAGAAPYGSCRSATLRFGNVTHSSTLPSGQSGSSVALNVPQSPGVSPGSSKKI